MCQTIASAGISGVIDMTPLLRHNLPRDQCQGGAFDTCTGCRSRRAFMGQSLDHGATAQRFSVARSEDARKNSFHQAAQDDHPCPVPPAKIFGFTFSEIDG
ncbi:hypothetical protein [Bradyrhizobium oligotrophicum]|uniref:hypothetical protein n=1 Tax=Bradyrhizobium oligotrophicum TaxID=44255 RepID=UPI0005A92B25|nr:hypothetical protein [Bradyrhizobium oligotrophicum]